MSASKDKQDVPARESQDSRQKRKREKLIRLDDLIPKENVLGGRQLLFGAKDTQQPTQIRKDQ